MKRKTGYGILKGSIVLAAVFFIAGNGPAKERVRQVRAEETERTAGTEYSVRGTFQLDNSPAAVKEGETIETEGGTPSLGEKFSGLGIGNGLSGRPGKIPSRTEETETQGTELQTQEDNTGSKACMAYKTEQISDPVIGKNVARAYVPSDYTVDGETIWCGKWQSLGAPAQVYLTALSPDQNTVLGYYSMVSYEEILEYSQNGSPLVRHQDGVFDSTTMTPMLGFMTADTYCDYLAKIILPGQQLEFCSQEEMTEEMQRQLDALAEKLYQGVGQMIQEIGYTVDGAYVGVASREYNVTLDGYPFKLVVSSATEGVQMSFVSELAYNMGTVKESSIAWDSPFAFFMLTPADGYEQKIEICEQFMLNTTVSDQFTQALATVRNQLTQARIQQSGSSMEQLADDFQSSMSSAMGSEDTYTSEEQISDYIFDQNDYTLSNGDHIKVPTSYEYVYEGDDGNVYVSDSSFDQPGGSVQLYPNE